MVYIVSMPHLCRIFLKGTYFISPFCCEGREIRECSYVHGTRLPDMFFYPLRRAYTARTSKSNDGTNIVGLSATCRTTSFIGSGCMARNPAMPIAFNYAIDGLGDRMTAFRERKHGRNSIGDNVNLDCIKLNNMKLKHGFGPILG